MTLDLKSKTHPALKVYRIPEACKAYQIKLEKEVLQKFRLSINIQGTFCTSVKVTQKTTIVTLTIFLIRTILFLYYKYFFTN